MDNPLVDCVRSRDDLTVVGVDELLVLADSSIPLLILQAAIIVHSGCPGAGGPGGAASHFSELECLFGIGDEGCAEFADEPMASRGGCACYRAGYSTKRSPECDRVTGDVQRT